MNRTSQTVVEAAAALKGDNKSGLVELSSGVKLTPIQIPNMIYMEVMSRFSRPSVPRFFNEDTGREEENPNHPDYTAAVEKWQTEMSKAVIDLMIVFGTEFHSCPDSAEGPNSKKWQRRLNAAGISVPDDEFGRYLLWVKTIAAPKNEDMELIMLEVGRLSGVVENDVQDAVGSFRD